MLCTDIDEQLTGVVQFPFRISRRECQGWRRTGGGPTCGVLTGRSRRMRGDIVFTERSEVLFKAIKSNPETLSQILVALPYLWDEGGGGGEAVELVAEDVEVHFTLIDL